MGLPEVLAPVLLPGPMPCHVGIGERESHNRRLTTRR